MAHYRAIVLAGAMVLALGAVSAASEEEFIPWESISVVSRKLPDLGQVTIQAKKADGGFQALSIQAFGRTETLTAADLERLKDMPLDSVQLKHEAGYERLGGHTVYLRFKRVAYNPHKILTEYNATVSVVRNKPGVTVAAESRAVNIPGTVEGIKPSFETD